MRHEASTLIRVYRDPRSLGLAEQWRGIRYTLKLRYMESLDVVAEDSRQQFDRLESVEHIAWGSAITGVDKQHKAPAWCTWDDGGSRLLRLSELDPPRGETNDYRAGIPDRKRPRGHHVVPASDANCILLVYDWHVQLRQVADGHLLDEVQMVTRVQKLLLKSNRVRFLAQDPFGDIWLQATDQLICIGIE
jgi:hypothetical protein